MKLRIATIPHLLLILIVLPMMPSTAVAGAYSVNDMIYHFNLVDSVVKEFDVKDCDHIPWLQKGLCQKIKQDVTSKLAKVEPYIGDNELIKRDYWEGKKKYGSKTYVTKTDVLLYVDGETFISVDDHGLDIDDVFYPYIARFYLKAGVAGDGDGYVQNKVCDHLHITCATHKDHFDMDFKGNVELDMIAGFVANAKVLETADEYILVLQPKFRLIPREAAVNIGYDIDGLDAFTSVANIINASHSAFDMSVDLAMYDFNAAINDFLRMNESAFISLAASTVIADDLTDDSISKINSEIITYFLNDRFNDETSRVLHAQEKRVNDKIRDKLGLDADGLVAYHFPKPEIHGQAVAELLPAIMISLN